MCKSPLIYIHIFRLLIFLSPGFYITRSPSRRRRHGRDGLNQCGGKLSKWSLQFNHFFFTYTLTYYQGAHIMLAGIVFQLRKPYSELLLNWTTKNWRSAGFILQWSSSYIASVGSNTIYVTPKTRPLLRILTRNPIPTLSPFVGQVRTNWNTWRMQWSSWRPVCSFGKWSV